VRASLAVHVAAADASEKNRGGFRVSASDPDLGKYGRIVWTRRDAMLTGTALTSARIEETSMGTEGSLTRFARELSSPDALQRNEAARQLWLRFSPRLAAEVRRRLNPRVLRRAGLQDLLQSLFASFFAAAPGLDGPPRNRAELWRLLVHFTMCKVANTAAHHHAQRRDVRREVSLEDIGTGVDGARLPPFEPEDYRGLDPADEAVARIEFARLLGVLPDDLREVFVMRLEGCTNVQIAAQIGRVERTVELKLRAIRGLLRPHLADCPPPPNRTGPG
jgi:DNA-directed RNA polymerase specialized sigma24 family protein